MNLIIAITMQIVQELPILLVWILGIRLAQQRRPNHPQVSRMAALGLVILLALVLIGDFGTVLIPSIASGRNLSTAQLSLLVSLPGMLLLLGNAAAWVILLLAVFGWREPGAARSAWEELRALLGDLRSQ